MTIVHLLMLLGRTIPAAGDDIDGKLRQAVDAPAWQARLRELQASVAVAKGYLYYTVKFTDVPIDVKS
jgi:hypothetical protein